MVLKVGLVGGIGLPCELLRKGDLKGGMTVVSINEGYCLHDDIVEVFFFIFFFLFSFFFFFVVLSIFLICSANLVSDFLCVVLAILGPTPVLR